jgi:anthranilate phosphoribosyltransferase
MPTHREALPAPRQTLEHLLTGRDLTEVQAEELLRELTNPGLPAAMAGALLTALRGKGVTAAEVRGFAGAMRALARRPALPAAPDAIDIVGTGGDSSGSLNLSTGAALLAAACGLPVVKHGNRSISSRSGSADLIEQLGFALPLDEVRAADCFAATGFTFLFAPYFHPAMRAVAPVRAALGIRTVFNLLGPLTNPAAPRFQLIGAYDAATAELMAATVAGMPIERAWVIHGAAGWDEATPIGPFLAYDVTPGAIVRQEIDPRDFGMAPCTAADLAGGDAADNLAALEAVFDGLDRGAHRSALTLQCGLALFVAGRAASIAAGIERAGAVLDDGRAAQWLRQLRAFAADSVGATGSVGLSGSVGA